MSITAPQQEAGEPSGPCRPSDNPPIRLRLSQRARLVDPSQVQTVRSFSTFCETTSRMWAQAYYGLVWNPFALRTVYRIAHPNHVGYSCWLNTIPDSGTPPPGNNIIGRYEIHCPTNTGLRDAAFPPFPSMKNAMPKLRHQADSVKADGHKRKRISKIFDFQDLCTLVIEQI